MHVTEPYPYVLNACQWIPKGSLQHVTEFLYTIARKMVLEILPYHCKFLVEPTLREPPTSWNSEVHVQMELNSSYSCSAEKTGTSIIIVNNNAMKPEK